MKRTTQITITDDQVKEQVQLVLSVGQRTIEESFKLGGMLLTKKEEKGHGNWQPFLEAIGLSQRTAHRLMTAYSEKDNFIEGMTLSELANDNKSAESSNSKPKPKPTFNATNDNIEWAKWTWNPVTGCEHGCKYCYARDIANRFYEDYKFEPHYYPDRLEAPQHTKIPKGREDEPGIKNVFVVSMGDLFGDWVPDKWIDAVFDAIEKTPVWIWISPKTAG